MKKPKINKRKNRTKNIFKNHPERANFGYFIHLALCFDVLSVGLL